MKIVMFYHSLYSDWNHGNAHFLRGIVKELIKRGYEVDVYEPENGWSLSNLIKDHGEEKLEEFSHYYPTLTPRFYNPNNIDYKGILDGADLVIVHEWNSPELVERIGEHKTTYGYKLLFHDTHHRAVSDVKNMSSFNFSN